MIDLALLDKARQAGLPRLGLRSPAREHLAQAVARTFMRVGLPLDIPSFELVRSGREERLFTATPQVSAFLREAGLVLTDDLPIVVGRRTRKSTGQTYLFVTTRSPEHRPPIEGAGMDLPQAERSFGRQLSARWQELGEGNEDYAWLRSFLAAD
ncbi:MAG: hypothetical protein HYY04_01535 [Chloroflexi bacterium]|nr:hypothetical protein [Chloroflexota bacterium]